MSETQTTAFDAIGGITNTHTASPLLEEDSTSLKTVGLQNDKSDHIHILVLRSAINSLLGKFNFNTLTDAEQDGSFNEVTDLTISPTFLGNTSNCKVLSDGIVPIQGELELFKERVGNLMTSGQEAVFNSDNFQNSTISSSDVQGLLAIAGGSGFTIANVNSHLRRAIDDGYNGRDESSLLSTGFAAQDDIIIEGQNPVTGSKASRGIQVRLSLASIFDPDGRTEDEGDNNALDFGGVTTTANTVTNNVDPIDDGTAIDFAISNFHTTRLQIVESFPA